MTTEALERAQAAKSAYRDNPDDDTHAEHRAASEELRYARWLARGGPATYEAALAEQERRNEALTAAGLEPDAKPLRDEYLYVRWVAENTED